MECQIKNVYSKIFRRTIVYRPSSKTTVYRLPSTEQRPIRIMEVLTKSATDLDKFRMETRAWLEENCPQSMRQPVKKYTDIFWGGKNPNYESEDQKVWFERMRDKGWTVPHWPTEYGGGGLSKQERKILKQEMGRLGCRAPLYNFGISMLGPALLKFGNQWQKKAYLTAATRGELWWCQGYSEPGAGSDLAGLQTRAEDRGDHYLVNGQKVWTSFADQSDWIFCLVRTDPEAPKHSGISFLLIDMTSPGVSTRPIKLISGSSPFCETFFDNVKVPKENLVGKENAGWTIAKYLLTHERTMISESDSSDKNEKSIAEVAIDKIGLENGILADTILRPDIARWAMNAAAFRLSLSRLTDEAKAGQGMGAKSSFLKYYGTELNKQKHELMMAITGKEGTIWEGEASNNGFVPRQFLRTKANSIEGGTHEVQLNIISKRILGLPSK